MQKKAKTKHTTPSTIHLCVGEIWRKMWWVELCITHEIENFAPFFSFHSVSISPRVLSLSATVCVSHSLCSSRALRNKTVKEILMRISHSSRCNDSVNDQFVAIGKGWKIGWVAQERTKKKRLYDNAFTLLFPIKCNCWINCASFDVHYIHRA